MHNVCQNKHMNHLSMPYEIHLHGDIPLREEVSLLQIQEALRPLWKYVGAASFQEGALSLYDEEPGILVDADQMLLQICWTARADDECRQILSDMCMGLNELTRTGAAIEVSLYDTEFDEDEEENEEQQEARDDFWICFVGPTPQAMIQIQRDMLTHDVLHMMQRHFEPQELEPVRHVIHHLFQQRIEDLASSIQAVYSPKKGGGGSAHGNSGRKPRRLH